MHHSPLVDETDAVIVFQHGVGWRATNYMKLSSWGCRTEVKTNEA